MPKRAKRGNAIYNLVSFLMLPLIAVNLYCCWKISELNATLGLQIFSSVINGLSQLIIVIIANTVAITILIIMREG